MSEYRTITIAGTGTDIGDCRHCDFGPRPDTCSFAGCPTPGDYALVPVADLALMREALDKCITELRREVTAYPDTKQSEWYKVIIALADAAKGVA